MLNRICECCEFLIWRVFVRNEAPIVAITLSRKLLFTNRKVREVLPTPDSPTVTTKWKLKLMARFPRWMFHQPFTSRGGSSTDFKLDLDWTDPTEKSSLNMIIIWLRMNWKLLLLFFYFCWVSCQSLEVPFWGEGEVGNLQPWKTHLECDPQKLITLL